MAYNEDLADRISSLIARNEVGASEKKMFGGMAYMIRDTMAFGVVKDELMVRATAAAFEHALESPHARIMDFTGRPMKGFLFVEPGGFDIDKDLWAWLSIGIEYALSDEVKPKKKKKS